MTPVGSDLGQGQQNERALMHPRMGQFGTVVAADDEVVKGK